MSDDKCPNCTKPITEENGGCLLHDLIGVLRDRGDKTDEELLQLHRDCNTDGLWDDLGKIADKLEDGEYSHHGSKSDPESDNEDQSDPEHDNIIFDDRGNALGHKTPPTGGA